MQGGAEAGQSNDVETVPLVGESSLEDQKKECARLFREAYEAICNFKIYDEKSPQPSSLNELALHHHRLSSKHELAAKLLNLGKRIVDDIGTPELPATEAKKIAESVNLMAGILVSDASRDFKVDAINKFRDVAVPMRLGRAALDVLIGAVICAAVGFVLGVLTLGVAGAFLGLIAGAAVGFNRGHAFFENRNREKHPEALAAISATDNFRRIMSAR
jgi:hypothetical protein